MGPITLTIIGLILLAIVVSVLLFFGKKFGFIEPPLANVIIWGTVIVIGVIFLILILKILGVSLPVHLP